jgi:hypothetical protein
MDAIILNKPVMLINVVLSPMPYAQIGGAYAVYETEDIKDGLLRGLNDKKLHKDLEIGRKKFLEEYLYKTDGKSSERIIRIIKQFL